MSSQTVLVVDDDEISQGLVCQQLAQLGFKNVQVADDGRMGLRMLAQMPAPPDYLICDVFMPNMDGIEFLDKLARKRYRGGVIMTSGGNPEIILIAQQLAQVNGINLLGTIAKPVTSGELGGLMSLDAVS